MLYPIIGHNDWPRRHRCWTRMCAASRELVNVAIAHISHPFRREAADPDEASRQGTVMSATFQLEGEEFYALNGGPQFSFTPAISFFVNCETQEEVDDLWEERVIAPRGLSCSRRGRDDDLPRHRRLMHRAVEGENAFIVERHHERRL